MAENGTPPKCGRDQPNFDRHRARGCLRDGPKLGLCRPKLFELGPDLAEIGRTLAGIGFGPSLPGRASGRVVAQHGAPFLDIGLCEPTAREPRLAVAQKAARSRGLKNQTDMRKGSMRESVQAALFGATKPEEVLVLGGPGSRCAPRSVRPSAGSRCERREPDPPGTTQLRLRGAPMAPNIVRIRGRGRGVRPR